MGQLIREDNVDLNKTYTYNYVRQSLGQSSSAFMRQGSKLVAQATIKQNLFRGISSVVGSLAGAATGTGYSMIKRKVMGW